MNPSISPLYRTFLTFIVMTGAFMAILDTTVVDVVIPKMIGPLSTDLYGVQWVITSYMIAAAVGLLLTHNLGRLIGLKWLFLTGLLLFTISSTLCALAGSLAEMITWRVTQGLGEAFIMASAQTILFAIYPKEKQGLAMGIFAMGVSFAPSIGPTVGGWITEHLSWRWIFYINVPVGVLNFVAGTLYLPQVSKGGGRFRFNFVSYLFLGTFTVLTLVVLSKGQQWGWTQSTEIVVMGGVALMALLLYLISELNSKVPLIDFSIFKVKEYTLSMGFYFLIMGLSIYQVFYLLPLYYENLKGLTTFDTGLHMLSFAIFIAILSPGAGILSDRFGPPKVVVASTTLYLFTTFFLIPSLNYYTPSVRAALITIPLGIALGSFFAPVSAMALGPLGPKTDLGVSLMHYLRFLGGSIGTAVATNTLEMKTAIHFEGIGAIQSHHIGGAFMDTAGWLLLPFMPQGLAEIRGRGLLTWAQYIHSLSSGFQDTFRESFKFAALGSIFLFLLIWVSKRSPTVITPHNNTSRD